MRLNILRRGEGLGGRGLDSGFGIGSGGAFMICLLWGTTALGMKIDTRQQLDKREPEPQRARVTEWVTVTMHGGWRVTEYSTTTITPTAATAATAIVTVTSIITTGTTVTNTVTATTTTVAPTTITTITTESTTPITTTTTSTAPIATTSTSTSTSASTSQIIETSVADTNTIVASTTAAVSTTAATSSAVLTATSAGTPISQSGAASRSGAVAGAGGAETPAKHENIVIVTDIVTGAPLTTSTVTEIVAAPTTTKWADSWGQGGPVRRRQAAQETVTLTATDWDWTDGVTTSIITVTATPTDATNAQTSMAIPTTVTTTMISTQVSTYTTQQTVTATTTPSASAPAVPSTITVDDTPTIGGASPKTPNVEVIVGACFGVLVGFIGIFVLAYLCAKKRRDENLRKESVGFSNGSFLRSSPGASSGVRGMIGSLRRGPSTRYNNIPSGDSMPNMSPLPAPPHSPPPQLPQLRVMPPSGEFNYEYTFGSPVSSIGEAQLHALTSGAISPPAVTQNQQDELFFDMPRQESEQPPWRSPVVETAIAETVVSSVSAQSDGPVPSSSVSGVSGQSPTRKPVPGAAADNLVSP